MRWLAKTLLWPAILSTCISCESPAQDQFQTLKIGIHGGGREIDARFEFVCRKSERVPGYSTYLPVPSSILQVMLNRQALLITATKVQSENLCINDPRAISDPRWQTVPLMVWLDRVEDPDQLDIINSSSASQMKKAYFLPELRTFEVSISDVPASETTRSGGGEAFADDLWSLDRPADPSAARMMSPARVHGVVEIKSPAGEEAVRRVFGNPNAQGVVRSDICQLLRFRDGLSFLSVRYPELLSRCDAKGRGEIGDVTLRFSTPQGLKRLADQVWAYSDSVSEVQSFVRDTQSSVTNVAEASPWSTGRSSSFWQSNVRSVRWPRADNVLDLQVRPGDVFYDPAEKSFLIIMDDVVLIHFSSFKLWRKL